jgi:hypothetical protein
MEFKTSHVVTFINPLPDEIGLIMRILEINGDRAIVEYMVGMNINPTGIVLLSDIKFWNS